MGGAINPKSADIRSWCNVVVDGDQIWTTIKSMFDAIAEAGVTEVRFAAEPGKTP
jgi:predicted ATP-grasp superfamily ATP-dependent carboligase